MGGLHALLSGDEESLRQVRRILTDRFDADEVLLTDSGTTALTLALRVVTRNDPDDPVALPGYCCYDVATAAVGARVPVLLYDLDPETLGPDLDSLAECVEDGARAVVIAHLYGVPVDLDPILDLAADREIPVIEDAAQGAGGRYGEQPLGSFGSLSVLSFGRGKGTTGCGGGALLGRGPTGRDRIRRLESQLPGARPLGWKQVPELLNQWIFGRPELYGIPARLPFLNLGETVYREPEPPSRMSRLSAGTLVRILVDGDREVEHRRQTARAWRKMVRSRPCLSTVEVSTKSTPGFLRFPVLADGRGRERLRAGTSRSLGVMPGYPRPLGDLEPLQPRCENAAGRRPGAKQLASSLFTVPTHSLLTQSDRSRLQSLLSGRGAS